MSATSSSPAAPPDATPPLSADTAFLTPWGFPRLRTCPACEYSLIGLPAPHRCPECGLEYDAFSCEWEKRRWRTVRRAVRLTVSLCWLLSLVYFMRPIRGGSYLNWISLPVFIAVVWPTVASGLLLFSPGRRFVVITPNGIHARGDTFRTVFVLWKSFQDYDEVGMGFIAWKPTLKYRKWKLPRAIGLRDVLTTSSERSQFGEAIQEGQRRYAQSASTNP